MEAAYSSEMFVPVYQIYAVLHMIRLWYKQFSVTEPSFGQKSALEFSVERQHSTLRHSTLVIILD
jgi:hypothetical protein